MTLLPDQVLQRILLVTGDLQLSGLLAKKIGKLGYQAFIASSCPAALEILSQGIAVDMALIDLALLDGPDKDGIIKQMQAIRPLPVVILISHADDKNIEKLRSLTRYGHVYKRTGTLSLQLSLEIAFELFCSHQKLEKSESQLREAQRIAQLGSWEYDPMTEKAVFWSEEVYNLSGIDPETFDGTDQMYLEIVHPDDRAMVAETYIISAREGRGYTIEFRIYHKKTGELRYLQEKGGHSFDENGKVLRSVGTTLDITERKLLELELTRKGAKLQNIIDGMNVGTWEWNIQTGEIRIDDRLAEILGYQTAELSPMNAAKWNELTHPQDLEKSDQQLDAHRAGQQEFYACELRMRHKNGHYVWVFDQGKVNEWDHQGQPLIMLGAIQEITERKQLENDLIESELRYRSLIESSCDVIFCLDKYGNFRFTNSAFAAAYHKTPEYFSDKSLWDVFPKDEADRRQEINARVFATGNDFTSEEIFATHAGNVHHLTTRNPVKNPTGEVVLNMIRAVDISQRKSIEEETRRLSFTDTLTGVYNRNYFEATLSRLSGSREYPITIISVDLDGLKLVNDTKGHRQGDYLLQTCARLLKSALRSSDILTRVGGDEFAIFLPQTNVPSGKEILRRIHSMIDDHNRASKDIFLSMSLGMATAEEAGTDLEHTYKRSDDKMYHNKAVKKRP